VLFTGLPGAGKTTLAGACRDALTKRGVRSEVLDGDELRARLRPALGFSREDRRDQLQRAVFIAELLAAHGVVPLLALVAPYADDRRFAREKLGAAGFVEVFLDPPLNACIARDPGGLYERMNADDPARVQVEIVAPYEPPNGAEVRLDTAVAPVDECVRRVIAELSPQLPR
jgi:adenylylsulfate kinase